MWYPLHDPNGAAAVVTERLPRREAFPHFMALIRELRPGRSLADLCEAKGKPRSLLENFTRTENRRKQMPAPERIAELAEVLECKPRWVHDALARDLGYIVEVEDSPEMSAIVAATETSGKAKRGMLLELFTIAVSLTPRSLRVLLAEARALRER